jgi:hypothetical protein
MVIVIEQIKKDIEAINKILEICPDKLLLGKNHLGFQLKNEIKRLERKLDVEKMAKWCEERFLEFNCFETIEEYQNWLNRRTDIWGFSDYMKAQNAEIKKVKKDVEDLREKKKKELELLETQRALLELGLPE